MRRYFDRLENAGWSGMDVAAYWQRLKKLGLTALATHSYELQKVALWDGVIR
ncbi:hypothetical protein OSTOST_19427 [Ostertagia ostertagi]